MAHAPQSTPFRQPAMPMRSSPLNGLLTRCSSYLLPRHRPDTPTTGTPGPVTIFYSLTQTG